jgi:two-component system, sensor histidine kinase LadS
MILKEGITTKLAEELISSDVKVMEFVASIKWANGFTCRKCGHDNYCEGKSHASRRCTRCKKEESAAANTLFHNVKFPLNKAFYIAYQVCIEGTDISSNNYSELLGINQMTCWKFRKRIRQCVENVSVSDKKVKLKDILLSSVL